MFNPMKFTIRYVGRDGFPYAVFNWDGDLCTHAESHEDAVAWIEHHSRMLAKS